MVVERVNINEEICELFSIDVTFVAQSRVKKLDSLIGEPVTISLALRDESSAPKRFFHGHINEVRELGRPLHNSEALRYQATVVPRAWFATQRVNCRIFQNLDVVAIVKKVLGEHGVKPNTAKLGSYVPYEYCVQYNESDWAFVKRLLAKEGIFSFFKHAESSHELVLADQKEAYEKALEAKVDFRTGDHNEAHIHQWYSQARSTVASMARRTFSFQSPGQYKIGNAKKSVPGSKMVPREVFEYEAEDPLEAPLKSRTTQLTPQMLDAYTREAETYTGMSNCRSFGVGHYFTFGDHDNPAFKGKSFVITGYSMNASVPSNNEGGDQHDEQYLINEFTAIPAEVLYRPTPIAKPVINGVQTAVVTGVSGSEIHADKWGRIKVQFHWDREGQFDEKSSCWIRVAQHWAGKGFGAQFLPRVGHEVLVEFLNGDPDQPIITGSVYNGDNPLPYATPAKVEESGIKTRSTKKGGKENFNEIRFVDSKGKEKLVIHAEKDEEIHVENDQQENVDNDRTTVIGNNDKLDVTGKQDVSVGKAITVTAGDKIAFKCGSSTITMDSSGNIDIKGTSISINGSSAVTVKGGVIKLN